MNLKFSMQQKQQNQDTAYQVSSKQKSSNQHHRGQSDDLNAIQANFIMPGNTQIHTNKQTSLVGSHGNTNQFNTALGSQRGDKTRQSLVGSNQPKSANIGGNKNIKKTLVKGAKYSSNPRKNDGSLK
jgi:hypothetical protein